MTPLDPTMLDTLDPRVQVPSYERSAATTGVVHFGVGGFHRAHEALYLDSILSNGDLSWGICGVGVMAQDAAARDAFNAQSGLYTLVTVAPDGTQNARIVGSLLHYLFAPDDPNAVVEALADPQTRIVSLTITEGGYEVNNASGVFEPTSELTLADLSSGGPPCSVLGYLTAGLRTRRDRGIPAFTVLSCDNVQGNGHVARVALTSFARALDPGLADWIMENVAFPCSMVDRITPVTTDETRRAIGAEFGIQDRWPVRSESYLQWVVEDTFPLGRPDLAAVGVQLVADVESYELMKLRLLNASHQAMSYLGLLSGHAWVHDACRDPLLVAFLRRYMTTEAIPTLSPVPGVDLGAYCDQLIARFSSEAVKDTLDRQVVDASERLPKFLLPVLREQLKRDDAIECCGLVLAAWSVYLESGLGANGRTITDQRRDALLEFVAQESGNPGALLDFAPVFGELGTNERLRTTYVNLRAALLANGAQAVLTEMGANS
ncbi:mannitol dehydrogenase family protein [Pengzhenrongella sicca]|uniref:Mannitol-1-phosphate 5-dehydrogenase n=1 Tax=Pengzhenrongella sicca TaxID=2819238 RepID=A0A8A4ZI23_9MICO|nr:mannitol dehydrogenase family protein [Pengzhenrongella sicca]QTE31041.1 mannitol dehydrogenase family protein [Pengzhenrongella sicca]